jgi:hypothetical protein
MDEVEKARQVLAKERRAVLTRLQAAAADAASEAERAAAWRRAWRRDVHRLLNRGQSAGVSVTEMAEALGVSRQWAAHLLKEREREQQLRRLRASAERSRRRA